jgi:hypothetical protein
VIGTTTKNETIIREILAMSPATGEVKCWAEHRLEGRPQIVARSSSVVRFRVGERTFLAGTKAWRERKAAGYIEALPLH